MAWQQLHDADMNVGYTGGWCLKYVQDAFGTDHPYPTALDAWNANVGGGNHPDELPPLGITVAAYFSLGNVPAGHVAIRLDDGWVASSTQPGDHAAPYLHRSLDDLIAIYGRYNGGCSYLGWSEYVGTEQVVAYQPDVVNATADEINQLYQELLGRTADDSGLTHYVQYTTDFVRQDLINSTEYREHQASLQAAANPVIAPVHNPEPVVEAPAPVAEPTPVPETPVTDTPAPIVTPIEVTHIPTEEHTIPVTITLTPAAIKASLWHQFIGLLIKLLESLRR